MTTPSSKDTIVERVRRAIERDNHTGVALPSENNVLVSDRQLGTTRVETRRVVIFYEDDKQKEEFITADEELEINKLIKQRPRGVQG